MCRCIPRFETYRAFKGDTRLGIAAQISVCPTYPVLGISSFLIQLIRVLERL
jgi:hypothetical protein